MTKSERATAKRRGVRRSEQVGTDEERQHAASTRDPKILYSAIKPSQVPADALAVMVAGGIAGNTFTAAEWSRGFFGEIDVTALQRSMVDSASAVNRGDLGAAEAMLMSQAVSLNAVYVNLLGRAHANQSVEQFQMNLRMAFRAQTQCRATLETLAVLKNPPVFAKQANIANGPQQVNNGPVLNGARSPSRVEVSEVVPSKLLEAHGERVDGGAAGAAGDSDKALAAVAEIDGAANARRKGPRVTQRVPRR